MCSGCLMNTPLRGRLAVSWEDDKEEDLEKKRKGKKGKGMKARRQFVPYGKRKENPSRPIMNNNINNKRINNNNAMFIFY